ncbi:GntR family transcriptional regulator [Paenalcaligenes niemegkensis]|uniref:GntR family transcriptional regulator n=1 Tax=Paenalcaligenes niemegkensis TaxID=2895469 RepID=UPI001EE84564|nr:GntR family transcriptional regulator [Paenalcaligenes niemegkensis]MCQ9617686.1 GntR family transcriptional regulator [Paenalcaligenes niemegkensis]
MNTTNQLSPTPSTKCEWAIETLRSWISTGRLAPGQRIDQVWLANELNISRMPLRQALVQLTADGLLTSRGSHSSVIVTPLSTTMLIDIYASRCALESMLGEVATTKIDEAGIQTIQHLIEDQESAVEAKDIEKYVSLDRQFHTIFYSYSGYEHACSLVDRLRNLSDRYVHFYAQDRHTNVHKSILEHYRMVRHIKERQAVRVRELIEMHINDGCLTLLNIVEEQQLSDKSHSSPKYKKGNPS